MHSALLYLLALVAFVSISGVMMPGPVLAVTIANGYKRRNAGVLVSLGHGIVEFPLMFLIYFGFGSLFTSNIVETVLGLVGGSILIVMGLRMAKIDAVKVSSYSNLRNSLISGLLTTISNPYFLLWGDDGDSFNLQGE